MKMTNEVEKMEKTGPRACQINNNVVLSPSASPYAPTSQPYSIGFITRQITHSLLSFLFFRMGNTD